MKYNSVSTYFSKIQNRQLIPVFLPLLGFMLVYYLQIIGSITPTLVDDFGLLLAVALVLMAIVDSLMAMTMFQFGVKRVKNKVSLGDRLAAYANWCLVRFALVYVGSWMMVVALYLTGFEWLSIAFVFHLLFYFLIWPSRERLANDLDLSNAEREVIFLK